MTIVHEVLAGDHLASIAARYRLGGWQGVWAHPDNAELRAARNPNVLLPGDLVTIPDRLTKTVPAATGSLHDFRLSISKLRLHIVLEHHDGSALAGQVVELVASGVGKELTTGGLGEIELDIDPQLPRATLIVEGRTIGVLIGHLDPVTAPSGLDARLANLGYLGAILDAADERERRLAVEEFQLENGLPITGQADDATRAKLEEVHGA